MLKNILSSKKVIAILTILTLVVLFLSLIKAKVVAPTITATQPSNNSPKYSTISPITVQFKEAILPKDFTVTSTPEADWDISQSQENVLSLSHPKQLIPKTKYVVMLNWRDKPITSVTFTTEATQQDYELIKNVKDEIAKNYPLAKLMPYTTSNYRVIYSTELTLEITIKNPNLTSQEVIDEVKTWVTQNGVSSSSHKYVISTPSSSPKPAN